MDHDEDPAISVPCTMRRLGPSLPTIGSAGRCFGPMLVVNAALPVLMECLKNSWSRQHAQRGRSSTAFNRFLGGRLLGLSREPLRDRPAREEHFRHEQRSPVLCASVLAVRDFARDLPLQETAAAAERPRAPVLAYYNWHALAEARGGEGFDRSASALGQKPQQSRWPSQPTSNLSTSARECATCGDEKPVH
jgi:hypothetical protein